MTYKRIHNKELSIIIEQTENNSSLLYEESENIYNEIKNFLDKKFPNQFKFRIQEKVGIDFFIKKMIKNENFTFVKYGDGELLCMIGVDGKNCDDHPYSLELKKLLEISFVKLLRFYDDVFLADWEDNLVKTRSSYLNVNNLSPKFADYDSFLTIKENINDEKLLNFYKLLKQSDRKKILVGPKKLEPVIPSNTFARFLSIETLLPENVFDAIIFSSRILIISIFKSTVEFVLVFVLTPPPKYIPSGFIDVLESVVDEAERITGLMI